MKGVSKKSLLLSPGMKSPHSHSTLLPRRARCTNPRAIPSSVGKPPPKCTKAHPWPWERDSAVLASPLDPVIVASLQLPSLTFPTEESHRTGLARGLNVILPSSVHCQVPGTRQDHVWAYAGILQHWHKRKKSVASFFSPLKATHLYFLYELETPYKGHQLMK